MQPRDVDRDHPLCTPDTRPVELSAFDVFVCAATKVIEPDQ
jgi:hypothetical protein